MKYLSNINSKTMSYGLQFMLRLQDVTSNIKHKSLICFFHYTNAVNLLDFFLMSLMPQKQQHTFEGNIILGSFSPSCFTSCDPPTPGPHVPPLPPIESQAFKLVLFITQLKIRKCPIFKFNTSYNFASYIVYHPDLQIASTTINTPIL
jgi:hypothetical protein